MTQENYILFINRTKKEMAELLDKTQEQLNKAKTKQRDYKILCNFWEKFCSKAVLWSDKDLLFYDSGALQPMPESVHKQFINMLFNIKNLNVLVDLGIYESFDY